MKAPWTYRVVWPVEDDDASYAEARGHAEQELPQLAEQAGVRLIGDPVFEMLEHDPAEWPYTELVLVAVADAVPALMSRDQWATAVAHYAEQGMTDGDIGRLLDRPRNAVAYTRRTNRIPPGVPCGYRSRDQIAEPTWPAA